MVNRDTQEPNPADPIGTVAQDSVLQCLWHYAQHENNVKVLASQLCLTLCGPMDYTVHGILQARILEWVAFPFSREYSQPRDRIQVSHIVSGFFTN